MGRNLPLLNQCSPTFTATGSVVHDTEAEFDGTTTATKVTNDKIELDHYITEEQTTDNAEQQLDVVAAGQRGIKFKATKNYLSQIAFKIRNPNATDKNFNWRLGTTYAGTELGSGTEVITGLYDDFWLLENVDVELTVGTWYYFTAMHTGGGTAMYWALDSGNNKAEWGLVVFSDSYDETKDPCVKLYDYDDGNYDHDQTDVDVGANVEWGTFSWDEVLDGGTIVVEVHTSPDGTDWTESKQTISSGGYITGNQRYLRYYVTITGGGTSTEVGNVTITYTV